MQNLLASLINSIEAIFSLLVLLFLFLGIFALLGTQIFGSKFKMRLLDNGGDNMMTPRANFDSFEQSFYTVFQVSSSCEREDSFGRRAGRRRRAASGFLLMYT